MVIARCAAGGVKPIEEMRDARWDEYVLSPLSRRGAWEDAKEPRAQKGAKKRKEKEKEKQVTELWKNGSLPVLM
jgi:hypothetical protein